MASQKRSPASTKSLKTVKAKSKPASKPVGKPSPRLSACLKVGDKAPAFNLLNQDGKPVRLDDFKGKQVVLYFYPRAMTPGCTIQACGIRDHRGDFTKAKTVVIGISPDKVSALAKFRERDQLNFDLLSDEEKTIAKLYGVWGKKKFMGREFMGVRRWTFIIDKNGKVSHIMDKVNTKSHHADVLGLL